MKPTTATARAYGILLVAAALSGCVRDSKPTQFYRLTAQTQSGDASKIATTPSPLIGLGAIRIPEYLNRPQLVAAISDHQYQLAEDHRWAERLDQNIALALYQALPRLLGTDRLVRYPWAQRLSPDYQIDIDILEFHIDAQGQSRLVAQWAIKHNGLPSISKRSAYQLPASTTDYGVMVSAQSQCLGKLAEDIAQALRQMLIGKP